MREVDFARLRDLLGQIQLARSRLGELATLSADEFLNDFRNTESAKYLLIVAIEAAIDVCNHVVARRAGRAPQDYADCFTVLAELGWVPKELTERLRRMARFRNLLVHLYWQVDNQRIFEFLQVDVNDLDEFVKQIAGRLNPSNKAE